MKTRNWILLLLFCGPLSGHAGPIYFMGLGDLPGGPFFSDAAGADPISADGQTVVGGSRSDFGPSSSSGREAFAWTESSGMKGLGELAGGRDSSQALAVSGDGSVAVGVSDYDGFKSQGFRYTQSSGIQGIGFLPGGDLSSAFSISNDGTTIVGNSNGTGIRSEAFSWTEAGGMVGLGYLPGGDLSTALAVSGDGSVIVGSANSSNGSEAFRWTQQTGMVGLGDFAAINFGSVATGITPDGSIIVGSAKDQPNSRHIAYRWNQSTGMKKLDDPVKGTFTSAHDISADGSVIVGQGRFFDPRLGGAMIWQEGLGTKYLMDLLVNDLMVDLGGWKLNFATGISDDGTRIVGRGENPQGQTEAWIVSLTGDLNPTYQTSPGSIPEPSTLLLLVLGLGVGILQRNERLWKIRETT